MNTILENNKSIDLTIIVASYNQKGLILQNLESIKYQIEHYGKEYKIQLIVADDCSSDGTVEICKKWLENNGHLFTDAVVIERSENVGTSKNISSAYKLANGNHLTIIDGDDIFANSNVLNRICACKENDIIACPVFLLSENTFIIDKKKYYPIVLRKFRNKKKVIEISKYGCAIENGCIVGRNLYTSESMLFSENFKLLDDQSRYAKMLEDVGGFEYRYESEPIIIYRLSEGQVTKKDGVHHKQIVRDKIALSQYMLKKEKNIWLRLKIKGECEKLIDYRNVYKFWNPIFWPTYVNAFYIKLNNGRISREAKRLIEIGKKRELQRYIEEIVFLANEDGIK